MLNEVTLFLSNVFLFDGLSSSDIQKILNGLEYEICEFKKGETVYSPSSLEKKLGFIISGDCAILQKSESSVTPMRRISIGDSFGIISVFGSDTPFPTCIEARADSKVVFITQNEVKRIMLLNSKISENLIRFLCDRVNFLNQRVATFSSGSVDMKLASFLLTLYKNTGNTEIKINKSDFAKAISSGRASLYRALNNLSCAGILIVNSKNIKIVNINALEEMLK